MYRASLEERFYIRVKKSKKCWIWNGYKNAAGYGVLFFGHINGVKKTWLAHRISYFLFNGKFSEELNVCHHCDIPACVNPKHLFLGTDQDNCDDMYKKNRQNPPKGERNRHAKLTVKQVKEIRKSYQGKFGEMAKLSRKYKVSVNQISWIIKKKVWREI